VTVSVIETEEKLRAAIPEIRLLVKEGLMALVDAEIVPLNETASG
jgi:PII-like signaling protein